jgi:pantoate--beta-alanine ligase
MDRMGVTARIDTIAALRASLEEPRRAGAIGLVPTMGALHAGHIRLIENARRECDTVVVSIFVNPLQFDRPDDLAKYPRRLDEDLAICEQQRVDLVFAPAAAEMYPQTPVCTVDVGPLGDHLCGRFRPGHFRGVATVVLKLFQIVQPHRAYVGEKDAQQVAIIKRMAADFNLPVSIVEVGTVREPDGLALSSRNRHLSSAERRTATQLYRALTHAREMIASGARDPSAITRAALAVIPGSDGVRVEYFDIVDPADMQPVDVITGPVRAVVSAWVGTTRLIDNVLCIPGRATG